MGKRGALLSVLFLGVLASATLASSSPASVLTVKLTVPDDSQFIYIPGVGRLDPDDSGNWTNLPHYFISSRKNGVQYSLIHNYQYPLSIGLESTRDTHTLVLRQELLNSNAFLAFSYGGWGVIQNRMGLIEEGTFLEYPSPTFAYGLGTVHPIQILLYVPQADLDSGFIIQRGLHDLRFSYTGMTGNKTVIRPERM